MTTTTKAPRFILECGKSIQFEITDEMLSQLGQHQNSFDHVLMIGLKNIVGDSHANLKREDFKTEEEWKDASKARAELKLAAILNGDLRTHSAPKTPKLSDKDAFIRSFIIAQLKAQFVAKYGKDSWKEKTEGDSGAEWFSKFLNANLSKFAAAGETAWTAKLAQRDEAARFADSIDFNI